MKTFSELIVVKKMMSWEYDINVKIVGKSFGIYDLSFKMVTSYLFEIWNELWFDEEEVKKFIQELEG